MKEPTSDKWYETVALKLSPVSTFHWQKWAILFCLLVLLFATFEFLFPSITLVVKCTVPDCYMLPRVQPTTAITSGPAPTAITNMTWNSSSVVFMTQCGQEFFSAPMNITYSVSAINGIDCTPVNASILESITSSYTTWCEGSNQPPSPVSPSATDSHSAQTTQSVKIGECFWQRLYTESYMEWKGTENEPGWQHCTVTVSAPVVVRTNGSSNTSLGAPLSVVQSNPYAGRPNGFYTNGTHEVIPTSGNVQPLNGNIAFNSSVNDMAMSHWGGPQQSNGPIIFPIADTVFQPASASCWQVTVFPRQSNWVELNVFCQLPSVQNSSGTIVYSAKDNTTCNIIIGNGTSNVTIVVGNGQTYQTGLYTYWSCSCSGPCSNTTYQSIESCVVNYNDLGVTQCLYDQPAEENVSNQQRTSTPRKSVFWSIVFWVLIAIASLLAIFGVAKLIAICCCNRKKPAASYATLIEVPAPSEPSTEMNDLSRPSGPTAVVEMPSGTPFASFPTRRV